MRELDVVTLRLPHPEAGERGAIVHRHSADAFEVEFPPTREHASLAVTLTRHELDLAEPRPPEDR